MKKRIFCFIVLCLIYSLALNAQWIDTGAVVCDIDAIGGFYALPQIASDNSGGAFVCWTDARNGTDYDIYFQHVLTDGNMEFVHNGIPLCNATNTQQYPRIISNGRGGAFAAWEDGRDGIDLYVYAQHINKDGSFAWQNNGIKACDVGGLFISIAKEESTNGLLLGWSTVENVFVQRLDSLGNRMWGDSGVQVTNRPGEVAAGDVAIVDDGTGGGIVTWAEGIYPNYRVYAQRIDNTGNTCWSMNGILLSDSTRDIIDIAICKDMNGGVIVKCTYSGASGSVQRINGSGQLLWANGGIPLTPSGSGGNGRTSSDDRGGVFVGQGLRMHHINSLGIKVWGDSGVVCISTLGSSNSTQVPDGNQGIYNFAEYFQNGIGTYTQTQWIDSAGNARFGINGKHVTSNSHGVQFSPKATTDGRGGAIVCWNDFRRGYSDVYIARVDTKGTITGVINNQTGLVPTSLKLEQNYPNPFNPETTITFYLTQRSFVKLIVYDLLGKEIKTLLTEERSAGHYSIRFDAKNIGSGTYFYCLLANNKMIAKKMIVLH